MATTLEKRAKALCERINTCGESVIFSVDWKRSKMWGRTPSLSYNGEKICIASGCGYDKLSALLSDTLQHLSPDIKCTSGAGVNATTRELARHGYSLRHICNDKKYNAFQIEKIDEEPI